MSAEPDWSRCYTWQVIINFGKIAARGPTSFANETFFFTSYEDLRWWAGSVLLLLWRVADVTEGFSTKLTVLSPIFMW